jgi:hypothetical protein
VDTETKTHLKRQSTWMRLLYTILFAIIFNIAEFVIVVIFVIQFLSKLFTGRVNEKLQGLGQNVGAYVYEIILFFTFHSDDMPYPFGPWPSAAPSAEPAAKPAAKSRSPRKRKTPPDKPAEEGSAG